MAAAAGDVDTIIRAVLCDRLNEIEKASDRDALVMYGPIVGGLDRLVNEALEAIDDRHPQKRLMILLHTGGGVVQVVERIVDSIRHYYDDVAVIVPDRAMSAGTIMAMSCDSILMTHFSRLGPIDPQLVRGDALVPALNYLIQWERLKEKDRAGQLTAPEAMLINKLDLAELLEFEQARELSITLLKNWLSTYKFKDWTVTATQGTPVTPELKTQRAEEIANKLSAVTTWHSHGRGISRRTLEAELNLKIDRLEEQPELAKSVRAYHDCVVDYQDRTNLPIHVHTRNHYKGNP